MYIISYYTEDVEGIYHEKIFATKSKETATKYVSKFNAILKKWKEFYSSFEEDYHGMRFLAERYSDYYSRYILMKRILECRWEEIETR